MIRKLTNQLLKSFPEYSNYKIDSLSHGNSESDNPISNSYFKLQDENHDNEFNLDDNFIQPSNENNIK